MKNQQKSSDNLGDLPEVPNQETQTSRPLDSQESGQQASDQKVPAAEPKTTVFQPPAGEQLRAPLPKRSFLKVPKFLIPVVVLIVLLLVMIYVLLNLKSNGMKIFGKKGEIAWWGFWEGSTVQPLIEEYQTQNPKITINYTVQSTEDYRERLTNALARGTGPDIFRIHNTWVPMFVGELETLPSSVMSASEFSQTFYPVIASDLTTSGGIVGIPLGFDAITLYVNEDIFAAAGKTPPKTWDEVRRLAINLTSKDKEGAIIQSGIALGRTDNVDHWQEILGLMMIQNGVNPAKPSGRLAEDALVFYSLFSSVDKVWNRSLPPSTTAFAKEKVAMYFGPSRRATEINRINPNLRYKTILLPQLRKDDPSEPDISYATYWVESVWRRSASKDIAWDFLQFLSTKESLIKLYENTEKTHLIGEPYPRIDMSDLLLEHPIVGSVIALAPNARSWYLAGHTDDGPTGINSQMSALFKEALGIISTGRGGTAEKALGALAVGIAKALGQYGITVR